MRLMLSVRRRRRKKTQKMKEGSFIRPFKKKTFITRM